MNPERSEQEHPSAILPGPGGLEGLTRQIIQHQLIDPSWPSGFKSVILAAIAQRNRGVLFQAQDPETPVVSELMSMGVSVMRAGDDPRLALAPGQPMVLVGQEQDLPEFLKGLSEIRFSLFKPGQELDPEELVRALVKHGLVRRDFVEVPGEFARRGGILDLFMISWDQPVRLEFFGNTLESIRSFSTESQLSTGPVDSVWLPDPRGPGLDPGQWIVLKEEPGASIDIAVQPNPVFLGNVAGFYNHARQLAGRSYRLFFYTTHHWRWQRLNEVVVCTEIKGELRQGFFLPDLKIGVMSSGELVEPPRRKAISGAGQRVDSIQALEPGELVVHADYGIGRFAGLQELEMAECAVVEYADGRLLVPAQALNRLSRYVGPEGFTPKLAHLSKPKMWLKRKAKARDNAIAIARQLVFTAAARKARKGHAFSPDTPEQRELEMGFGYPETPDQLKAIQDVKNDMESPGIMERLVAGEVGFGKTEVALRAGFKAVMDGKQVALLVPTTLLALQHYETFSARLKDFPVRVEMISRLVKPSKIKEILADTRAGKVDILIGTHRLLAKDVAFRDLGLVIIDEEHRFGVKQKEKLKRLRLTADTLLMTATPIPRTLSMALGEILNMSVIDTPPIGRQEVETIVSEYSPGLVRQSIEQELDRNGQVFYVRNRISSLDEVEKRLRRWFSQAEIRVVHGRSPKSEIERAFTDFYTGKIDILLSTAIIESGIDFPNANTLIVERAEEFGLAQLHQLRGRVGRGSTKAFAFFFTGKKLSHKAKRRLEALARYHHLGSGMKIALADLAIRGSGDLLGVRQHGTVSSVGYSLYLEMVAEAAQTLLGKQPKKPVELEFRVRAMLPNHYIPDPGLRALFYHRLSSAKLAGEVEKIAQELRDRFGPLPKPAENLIQGHLIRIWARENNYDFVAVHKHKLILLKGQTQHTIPVEDVLQEII